MAYFNFMTCLTIGNFDGVHLGHRELIRLVTNKAKQEKIPSCLLTFNPHPVKVLAPQKLLKNIFDLEDRVAIAHELGLDQVLVEPFTKELSQLSPMDFFQKIVMEKVNPKFLFVGHDFSFAKNRSGTLEVLEALCKLKKVNLTVVPPVTLENEVISSTKVRAAIKEGQMEKARRFLDRSFYLKGIVEKGEARGKRIGFPTANLLTHAELLPKKGVYITTTEIKNKVYHSLTNVGQNPTFTQGSASPPLRVETHILNFDEDIYGEKIKVFFHSYLRDEMSFSSVDHLITAIKKDVKMAEAYFIENSGSH